MNQTYDDELARLTEEYNTTCVPEQIEPDSEHHSGDFNCNNCDDDTCEFWSEYNYKDNSIDKFDIDDERYHWESENG